MSRSGPVGHYSRRARRVLRQGKPPSNRVYDMTTSGPRIVAFMRTGMYFKQAALAAGVSPETAHVWRRLGRLGVGGRDPNGAVATEEHVRFHEEVEQALATFEAEALSAWVAEVHKGNWQASRDLLARRFPNRWGNTEHRQLEVHGSQQMELQLVWGDEDEGRVQYDPLGRFAHDELPDDDGDRNTAYLDSGDSAHLDSGDSA